MLAGRLLSRRWRYEWTSVPNLIFDRHAIPSSMRRRLVEIVDQVLLLHNGPIRRFSYDHLSRRNLPNMVEWLLILSRNGIKELKCSFNTEAECKLPSTLFLCQELVCLELSFIKIELPRVYNGFGNLVSLQLKYICITDDDFAFLISMCPLLKKLSFRNFYGCGHLKINAPNLHELEIIGSFDDLSLENTPLLAILSVGMDVDADFEQRIPDKFISSLKDLLRLESLHLGSDTILFMTNGNSVGGFPTYNHLKSLFIQFFNFQDEVEVLILRCLLQSSPMLEELFILADTFFPMDNLPSLCVGREWSDLRFNHLKEVFVLEQAQTDLGFIKLILANAPVLEFLELKLDLNFDKDRETYEQIMQLPRSSTVGIFYSSYS